MWKACTLENGVVRTPTGFKAAYDTLCEGGWIAMDAAREYGGQGMPQIIHTPAMEPMVSANMALNMYPSLSHGAINALMAAGSEAQKAMYLPNMVKGVWSGTMNLTEPQCGTDLGLIRTKADPQADGSYKITGQKIWISAGEHDLTDNIIHLVLAKIPGGPEGGEGDFPVYRPEGVGECRRVFGGAQQPVLWRARTKDGHSRQRHLCHAL